MRWVKGVLGLGACSVCKGPALAALPMPRAWPRLSQESSIPCMHRNRRTLHVHKICCPCCQSTAVPSKRFCC